MAGKESSVVDNAIPSKPQRFMKIRFRIGLKAVRTSVAEKTKVTF
jgi:hypothetical protein